MKTLTRSAASLGLLGLLAGVSAQPARAQDNAAPVPYTAASTAEMTDAQIGAAAQSHAERAATILGEIGTALAEMKASTVEALQEPPAIPDRRFEEPGQAAPQEQPARPEFTPPPPDTEANALEEMPPETRPDNYGDMPRPDETGDYYPDLYMDGYPDRYMPDTSGPDYPLGEYDAYPDAYRDDYPHRYVPEYSTPTDLFPADRPQPETPEFVTPPVVPEAALPEEMPQDTTDLDAPLLEPDDDRPALMPEQAMPESEMGADMVPTDPLPLR